MASVLQTGLAAARRRGVVRSFMVIAVLPGISSEVFDRLWTARVVDIFPMPTLFGVQGQAAWFTVFALVGALIALATSLITNRIAPDRVNALHPAKLLALVTLIQGADITGFALSGSLWPALLAMWVRKSAHALAYPVQAAWLNRNVGSHARATTISLTSQADAFGQVVGGPPLGALAGRTSIPTAMVAAAAILTPVALIYARLGSRTIGRPRPADEVT